MSENLQSLWGLVRRIPRGRCAAYSALGRALPHPCSGFLVGRWMARAPEGVPWWRVVAKDGRLPVHKKDPHAARDQRARLELEGVAFVEEAVDMLAHGWEPETPEE